MKTKKMLKDAVALGTLGIATGALAVAGGSAGVAAFSQYLPATGSLMGSSMVIDTARSFGKIAKRRR